MVILKACLLKRLQERLDEEHPSQECGEKEKSGVIAT